MPPFGQRPLVLKEGGVRLSLLVLRACSYKTKAEAWQQGNAPSSSRGGCRFLLIVMTLMNTDILVDNQRNQRNLRENSFCQSNGTIPMSICEICGTPLRMKAMSVKYKMLSDKNNIDNDRLYRPAALSELLEAWLAVFESRRPHRGDGKHNRQSPDTADTYQN